MPKRVVFSSDAIMDAVTLDLVGRGRGSRRTELKFDADAEAMKNLPRPHP